MGRSQLGEDEISDKETQMLQMPLVDDKGAPCRDILEIFLNPDDRRQQDVFRAIKRSGRSDVIHAYVSAAVAAITSNTKSFNKSKALRSLVLFFHFGDEGIVRFTTWSRDVLGESYYSALEELSAYFQSAQASINELREVLVALGEMDFFRVKHTMMLAWIYYEYPKSTSWFLKRLKVVKVALSLYDNEIALIGLAFLVHSFGELKKLLNDDEIAIDDKKVLLETLELVNIEISQWLLSSDWRVVGHAIVYCGLAKLLDNREIIEQLVQSSNKTVQEVARHVIECFDSDQDLDLYISTW